MAHPYKTPESAGFVIQLFKVWESNGWRTITLGADSGLKPMTVKQKIQNGFYWLIENTVDETARQTWEIHSANTRITINEHGVTLNYKRHISTYVMSNLDQERLALRASLDQWMRGMRRVGDVWPTHEIQIPLIEDDFQYFSDVLMRERANGFTALIDRTTQRIVFSYLPTPIDNENPK